MHPMSLILRDDDGDDHADRIDEEAEGRHAFQVENIAIDFTETEKSIRHDVYPDSDEEADREAVAEERVTHIIRGEGALYKGKAFFNGIEFKECVTDYALKTGYNLKQYRYDKDKIGFKCVGGENGCCEWQVYASSLPKDPMWRIRVYKSKHICIPNGQCEIFKVPVIARLFVDKIREDPEYFMPMKIEKIIKEQWKISVTRPQCQAARNKALRWIEVEFDLQFARLRDYAAEIMEANKDSVVEIGTVKNDAGEDLFNRFYVCFDVLRTTWKESCRPLLGVDSCFLKAKMKGQLLVALGRDADNVIYPITWSVVQVENTKNWRWFVKRLKTILGLDDGDGYVLVSDRHKGLIKAVELELPKMEHRKCVRHIYGNLKKNHASKNQMKPLIWNLAWCYDEKQFEQRLKDIRAYDIGVYNDVMKANPKSWCRAFYKMGNYCEDVENNSTESFNNTINKAREKPFVAMLETVRRLAMVRIAKQSAISHSHKGVCTPYVSYFLAAEHKQVFLCKIRISTNGMYEVQLNGGSHRVCLMRRTFTCLKFQICGIPCEHAYGVILHKKLTAEDYVCLWFRTEMWKRNYAEGLVPQRGPQYWPSTEGDNVHMPPAPPQPGRKKMTKADKKRMRGVNESPTKKKPQEKKRIMHCGICGSDQHNCRFHMPKRLLKVNLHKVNLQKVVLLKRNNVGMKYGCN